MLTATATTAVNPVPMDPTPQTAYPVSFGYQQYQVCYFDIYNRTFLHIWFVLREALNLPMDFRKSRGRFKAVYVSIQYISVIVPVLGPQKIGTISNRHYIRYTMDCKLPTSCSPSIFYFGSYLNQMLMDFIQIWMIWKLLELCIERKVQTCRDYQI